MTAIDQLLTDIARQHLGISTLKTRRSDSLDFHNVAVWAVTDALVAAYQAGLRSGNAPQPLILLQDISLAMHDGGMKKPKDWLESIDRTIAEAMVAGVLPDDDRNLPDRFDGYEIHGLKRLNAIPGHEEEPEGIIIDNCEQVPDDEAEFWSLFGHIPGQGADCIGDFTTREHAEEIYARITGRPYGPRHQATSKQERNPQ
jgi:hypothetical protein